VILIPLLPHKTKKILKNYLIFFLKKKSEKEKIGGGSAPSFWPRVARPTLKFYFIFLWPFVVVEPNGHGMGSAIPRVRANP
jgi:hypothetical protein